MRVEKVTRAVLKTIVNDQTIVFELPNFAAVESGRNTAYQYQKIIGTRFMCKVSGDSILSITRRDYVPSQTKLKN